MDETLRTIGIIVLSYFVALNGAYVILTMIAWRAMIGHMRESSYMDFSEIFSSPLTPGVSVLLPAYNEEAVIVDSVRALLALRFPKLEIVVINDGSTDRTLDVLVEEFELAPVRIAVRETVPHQPIRGTYVSRAHPDLMVVDKENGGCKADAANGGLVAAKHPYVCLLDADTVVEEDTLLRMIRPVVDDPEAVVAVGGIVRIVNGCIVTNGRIEEVRLPRNPLATFQVVEYFRAFLSGRVAWSRLNSTLIVSGALGLFDRATVEDVGGWWAGTVGEDFELIVRLHREMRVRGRRYQIPFVPDPVCWTAAPETVRGLLGQRRRWQRGLMECVWRHRRMVANPRYGAVGLLGLPFFVVFEMMGPLIELLGYAAMPFAVATGAISVTFFLAFLALAVVVGLLLSLSALMLEEFSFRRHKKHRDVARMVFYSFVETFGVRQAIDLARLMAFVDVLRRKKGWTTIARTGIGRSADPTPSRPTNR